MTSRWPQRMATPRISPRPPLPTSPLLPKPISTGERVPNGSWEPSSDLDANETDTDVEVARQAIADREPRVARGWPAQPGPTLWPEAGEAAESFASFGYEESRSPPANLPTHDPLEDPAVDEFLRDSLPADSSKTASQRRERYDRGPHRRAATLSWPHCLGAFEIRVSGSRVGRQGTSERGRCTDASTGVACRTAERTDARRS